MILASADYPFMNILWSMLIFTLFFMWIWVAIMCFADIFRRRDIGGVAKAMWIIFIIVLPYLGVLVYLIANNNGLTERSAKDVAAQQAAFDQHVREVSGSAGPASEIASAKALLDAGTITQADFDALKAKALGS